MEGEVQGIVLCTHAPMRLQQRLSAARPGKEEAIRLYFLAVAVQRQATEVLADINVPRPLTSVRSVAEQMASLLITQAVQRVSGLADQKAQALNQLSAQYLASDAHNGAAVRLFDTYQAGDGSRHGVATRVVAPFLLASKEGTGAVVSVRQADILAAKTSRQRAMALARYDVAKKKDLRPEPRRRVALAASLASLYPALSSYQATLFDKLAHSSAERVLSNESGRLLAKDSLYAVTRCQSPFCWLHEENSTRIGLELQHMQARILMRLQMLALVGVTEITWVSIGAGFLGRESDLLAGLMPLIPTAVVVNVVAIDPLYKDFLQAMQEPVSLGVDAEAKVSQVNMALRQVGEHFAGRVNWHLFSCAEHYVLAQQSAVAPTARVLMGVDYFATGQAPLGYETDGAHESFLKVAAAMPKGWGFEVCKYQAANQSPTQAVVAFAEYHTPTDSPETLRRFSRGQTGDFECEAPTASRPAVAAGLR